MKSRYKKDMCVCVCVSFFLLISRKAHLSCLSYFVRALFFLSVNKIMSLLKNLVEEHLGNIFEMYGHRFHRVHTYYFWNI